MDLNPYAPPSPTIPGMEGDVRAAEVRVDFAAVIRRWEKLRLVYNGVLTMLVLVVAAAFYPRQFANPVFWLQVTFGAVVANFFYLLGPAIEGYGRYLRFWHIVLTWLLFLAGLGFTALLALASLSSFGP